MDIRSQSPLTCRFLYIYLSPSSTGLFSSSFSEEQGTKRGDGLQPDHTLSTRPPGRPGHQGLGAGAALHSPCLWNDCTWRPRAFRLAPGLLTLSLPQELNCTPPTQEAGPCWASGFKRHLGDREMQQWGGEGPCTRGCDC